MTVKRLHSVNQKAAGHLAGGGVRTPLHPPSRSAPEYKVKWLVFGEGIKVSATGCMATRQPILELPCWSDNKESQQLRVYYLRECRKANLPREIDITIYCTKISPLLEYASPVWGSLSKYLAKELQSIQNRYLDVIGIPKTSLPTLEDRCLATKRELERIVNDINHQNQILLTKLNTSNGYNLRSKPGSIAIPKSAMKRHIYQLVYSKSCNTPPFIICIFLLTFIRDSLNSISYHMFLPFN